jgi:hypothetical protein
MLYRGLHLIASNAKALMDLGFSCAEQKLVTLSKLKVVVSFLSTRPFGILRVDEFCLFAV